ncbi:winged helix-turn-helix domain-containing protein [Kribbella jejuensis]|uniref:Transcriptional regulator n=1 Tax=Kribbella jejuensis TaxID=236068 RepID=A0A542EMV8_9ACTN|nr:winged helix-turn-helix domain-containing protein [Kribbella jejuensis]TQJ16677.1 transcriptional regulator [Kribbella jejuensis]
MPIAAGAEDRPSDSSLIIGVAASTAERVQLARMLGEADALLLVSNADQARAFLELTGVTNATQTLVAGTPRPTPIKAVPEPVAELQLDVDRRVVRWKDREMPLTRLEHDFLHCLVAEPGRVWTYQRLHHAVWGNEHLGHGSHIHSVVKRLRQKLSNLGATVTIHAVRGVGFHLLPTA